MQDDDDRLTWGPSALRSCLDLTEVVGRYDLLPRLGTHS